MVDAGCRSIAIMGTAHEIGYFEGKVDGNTPCNPLSLYGIAKNALRQSVLTYVENKDVSLKWLRAFYITGDDSRNKSIFANIHIENVKRRKNFISFYTWNKQIRLHRR